MVILPYPKLILETGPAIFAKSTMQYFSVTVKTRPIYSVSTALLGTERKTPFSHHTFPIAALGKNIDNYMHKYEGLKHGASALLSNI